MRPPFTMVAGPALVIARFASGRTLRVALAATLLEPALVVSAPAGIVFRNDAPGVAAVTSTENEHEPFAGTTPPVSVTLVAVLVTTPPPHVVLVFGVADTVTPAGRLSVTVVTMIAAALPLFTVMVSTEIAAGPMVAGTKAFETEAPTDVTVRGAVLDAGPVAACGLDT